MPACPVGATVLSKCPTRYTQWHATVLPRMLTKYLPCAPQCLSAFRMAFSDSVGIAFKLVTCFKDWHAYIDKKIPEGQVAGASFLPPSLLLAARVWQAQPMVFLRFHSPMCQSFHSWLALLLQTSSGKTACPAFGQGEQLLVSALCTYTPGESCVGFYSCLVTMVRAHPWEALGELLSALVGRMVRALLQKPCMGFCTGFVGAWCAHTSRKPRVGSVGQGESSRCSAHVATMCEDTCMRYHDVWFFHR